MSSPEDAGSVGRPHDAKPLRRLARSARYLLGGGLAGLHGLLVLAFLVLVAALSLVGVGLLLAGTASGLLRRWCGAERGRVGRALGRRIGSPYLPPAPGAGPARRIADGTLPRDLAALLQRIVVGIPLGAVSILVPVLSVQALALPAYWWAMPDGKPAEQFFVITSWWLAAASGLIGLAGLAAWWFAVPAVAAADAKLLERLLAPGRDQELRLRARMEEQRRRSAVDLHSAELRRIERDLHDAAQNRLVAVSMFIGTAQRQLTTGKGDIATTLAKAQDASRDALAEMRRIIRGVYPPALAEEGLVPALGMLADRMQIPTRLHIEAPAPTAASVDAALYFSVAEALTNVAKHSGATTCDIHLTWTEDHGDMRVITTVTDNGHGGAEPAKGTGLSGIESRIEALGGTVAFTSPPGGPTAVRMELPCES
ncbi:sensor histidine kinase [Yinghuangia soli]|uniref:histidine kinase n=1 Tax=Yinghuangia soli TaxID=2908204 RepID=A0AA41Q781_9ACTN|nr:sensor histidine kinase [Yinghuangia soli]MCF2532863.1 sensor histidine kinase [Yinghuangia soli]